MEFTKKLDMLPNALLAYKILLTIPVTVASAERSFSKIEVLSTEYNESKEAQQVIHVELVDRSLSPHIVTVYVMNKNRREDELTGLTRFQTPGSSRGLWGPCAMHTKEAL
ncbi:putative hAT dimerization domain-containing protein [Tanacetum coccineum]